MNTYFYETTILLDNIKYIIKKNKDRIKNKIILGNYIYGTTSILSQITNYKNEILISEISFVVTDISYDNNLTKIKFNTLDTKFGKYLDELLSYGLNYYITMNFLTNSLISSCTLFIPEDSFNKEKIRKNNIEDFLKEI